jgi:predicted nuclease of predicted toxin-antitoxin system
MTAKLPSDTQNTGRILKAKQSDFGIFCKTFGSKRSVTILRISPVSELTRINRKIER